MLRKHKVCIPLLLRFRSERRLADAKSLATVTTFTLSTTMYYSEQHPPPSFDFVKDSNDSNESGDQNWYYLYLSILKLSESNNNFKNLPTKNIQEGTIVTVTSWGPEYKFYEKNLDFIRSQNSNRYNKSAAICDDLGGTKYE